MRIDVETGAFWATIVGSEGELDQVVGKLREFAAELAPSGQARSLCLRTPGHLRVPAGAVLLLEDRPGVLSARGSELAEAGAKHLEAAGLLRDYQARAVGAALTAPLGRATVDVVMGGGKTRIAAALAAVAQAVGGFGAWLYLVQNGELARQAEAEIAELLPMMAARLGGPPAQVTATTYSGIKKLPSKHFAGVIVDECHLLPAPTRCLPFALVKATWRIGLSGTLLDRTDTKNALIIALLGPRVCEVKIPELEEQEHLARGRVQVLRYDHRLKRLVS
jgi:superfamily II DNA or RNA helicase